MPVNSISDDPEVRRFILKNLPGFNNISPLTGDASVRRYFRIYSDTFTSILCLDDQLKSSSLEDYAYYQVYLLFRRNKIPVPELLDIDPGAGLLLLEDLGDVSLEKLFHGPEKTLLREYYFRLIRMITDIQSLGKDPSLLPFNLFFDTEKLMFEFEFFITHMLKGYLNVQFNGSQEEDLKDLFRAIAEKLNKPKHFVLNHRDYHSRNVMIRDGNVFIIDFQDSRMGLPLYDLVSLIRDSYLVLEDDIFIELKDYYYKIAGEKGLHFMNRNEFEYYFDLMAFQRNIKALGTFGYQATVLGKKIYARYIPQTARYLQEYIANRDDLKPSGKLLEPWLKEFW